MKNTTIRSNYTAIGTGYQLKMPLDVEVLIPEDDSVRLVNAMLEELNYSSLYREYSAEGRPPRSGKHLFKVLVYGYMNDQYSSRKIERACRRDINYKYLLADEPVPDHNTIARFRSKRLVNVVDDLFEQLVERIKECGELTGASAFVDGTKLESVANRYTFVWKKSVQKHETAMQKKMKRELPEMAREMGVRYYEREKIESRHLRALGKKLRKLAETQGVEFVQGKGKRKTQLQRAIEQVEGYATRQKQYEENIRILGERNSFAKTDHDATFMRMKEDHMRNGQLKPGYNVVIAVDSEYIVGTLVSQERSDSKTMIPLLDRIGGYGYQQIVADAGFESEENYTHMERNGQQAFIKPSNYEQCKTRKYKSDIGKRENMAYDAQKDAYTCHAGKSLNAVGEKRTKSKAGYPITTTVYECAGCEGCPHKAKCIKPGGKAELEKRSKRLYVSKTFSRQRSQAYERITTNEGVKLRMNRSIQVEGAFGVIKQNHGFRRFLLCSKIKVEIEVMILGMAFNINKFHNKIQSGRCGTHLHSMKTA